MSVADLLSETRGRAGPSDALATIRAVAGVTASFSSTDGVTRLATLAEYGGYRAKFPDPVDGIVEAVVINTGGGVAGGDRIDLSFAATHGAAVRITTSSAERIYRSTGADAGIVVRLEAGPAARLTWTPQPTLLFSGARLGRRIDADMSVDARLVIAEATIFGRTASGEVMGEGLLRDHWRVRRDGRLIFADATRLDGDIGQMLARPAIAAGISGTALLLAVAPGIEDRIEAVRAALSGRPGHFGASTWDGLLVMRGVASDMEVLRSALRCVTDIVTHARSGTLSP